MLSKGDKEMNKEEFTKTALEAKKVKGLTFADIGKAASRDQVWVASVIYGAASAKEPEAKKIASALGLGPESVEAMMEYPYKGSMPPEREIPTDPMLYRIYEVLQVYGEPLKAVTHEMFGDGILSAIDFTLKVDKEADPKGDRVVWIMNGKFLPYKEW